ncbi:MAG: 2-phospho-L-lactate transferase [Proteobacteria bacterium]|nr:2-phospho-L-lactate transferase [Pseudomonadota bacterium]
MATPRYLAITGGIGGAKLALGLSRILGSDELAFIVNTGDDFEHLGLHISPDIDTLVYTLAGESNLDSGWGRSGESWQFMAAVAALGGETWFRLGDKDLAMHVERTRRLVEGQKLTPVTACLATALGVTHRILPMSDDAIRTVVHTTQGDLDFQHYFVRDKCEPIVTGFDFSGAEHASLTSELAEWLQSDDLSGVIVCPSNPFVSIDPILAVPGLREALQHCAAPVIAVSPIVGGLAIRGPTVKMMQEMAIPPTTAWVAGHYRDFLQGFIVDTLDAAIKPDIEELGIASHVTQTVMQTLDDRVHLADACLEFIAQLSQSQRATTKIKE